MTFTYLLEHEDGSPAEPPTLWTAVPNWAPGDAIPLGNHRILRVVRVRPDLSRRAVPSSSLRPPRISRSLLRWCAGNP